MAEVECRFVAVCAVYLPDCDEPCVVLLLNPSVVIFVSNTFLTWYIQIYLHSSHCCCKTLLPGVVGRLPLLSGNHVKCCFCKIRLSSSKPGDVHR